MSVCNELLNEDLPHKRYISFDQYDRRVTELLTANNELLERARGAEAALVEASATPAQTEWIEFFGEKCPCPQTCRVDILRKSGEEEHNVLAAAVDWRYEPPPPFGYRCMDSRVIGYRMAAPAEEAAPHESAILEAAIDRMGWDEINAFNAELRRGQDITEDAGGYILRCIKCLFGIKPKDTVTTYRDAARAMLAKEP